MTGSLLRLICGLASAFVLLIGVPPRTSLWAAPRTVTALAGWPGGSGYFYVRSAPRLAAEAVGSVVPGDTLQIVRAVQGDSVAGNNWWYQVRAADKTGYVSSNAVASIVSAGFPWTGIGLNNGDASLAVITAYRSPTQGSQSAAVYALESRFTVVGTVSGDTIQTGDAVWYRVAQGSLPPVYIYSAYVKFVGAGTSVVPTPLFSAAAVAAIDLDTGTLLFGVNERVRRFPASTVKMMTALVALQHLQPNTVLTVPNGVASVTTAVGGSAMGLLPGEMLTVRELLYGLLMVSAGDAAYTLALATSGSQSAFVRLMNAEARHLGMRDTVFTDPEGYDDPGEHSTAFDLATLARYLLQQQPLIASIVATQDHRIEAGGGHPVFQLHNLNQLLGTYPGAFGVKTGTTPDAGQNLVAGAKRAGHRVVLVVLGSTDRYADAVAVLDYVFARFPTHAARTGRS